MVDGYARMYVGRLFSQRNAILVLSPKLNAENCIIRTEFQDMRSMIYLRPRNNRLK